MRLGRCIKGRWVGLVTDHNSSRVFLVSGVSVVAIDWERKRVLSAALEAKAKVQSHGRRAWRAHFAMHGWRGVLNLREGMRTVREYVAYQERVSDARHRMYTEPIAQFFGNPPHVPVRKPNPPQPPMRRAV